MRRPFPHAAALVVVLAMSACTGTGSADPTTPPSASSSASSPSTPTTPETPLPTATPSPTATATPDPTPPATPSPTFTGGIDPPTQAPEGFSEFSVPPPQDLTEDYAAWVLAEWYRAEDNYVQKIVDMAGRTEATLPDDLDLSINALYGDQAAEVERQAALMRVQGPQSEQPFVPNPGRSSVSNIELLDATQECLILRYVHDRSQLVREPSGPEKRMAVFKPLPEIDATGFNPTPWRLIIRAPLEDVSGDTCS